MENEILRIPNWYTKHVKGNFDFSEEKLDAALEKVKAILLEYNGVVTLRKSEDKIYFGAILSEQEQSEVLETAGD